MRRKYLIYTLFALLAVNMSWNFEKAQSIQLASAETEEEVNAEDPNLVDFDYIDYEGERVKVDLISDDEVTTLTSDGTKKVRTLTYKIKAVEGNLCETCFVDKEIQVEYSEDLNLNSHLTSAMDEILEQAEKEKREKRLAEEREERKKQKENCSFEDLDDKVECLNERIADIRDELDYDDLERSERKELERKYSKFMDRISDIAENEYEDVREKQNAILEVERQRQSYKIALQQAQQELQQLFYKASFSPDARWQFEQQKRIVEQYKNQIKKTDRELDRLDDDLDDARDEFEYFADQNYDPAVEQTIDAITKTEKNYMGFESQYNQIASYRMRAQIDPQNRIAYDQTATALERRLNYQMDWEERVGLDKRLDRDYEGGLSRNEAQSYITRYDDIRQRMEQDIQSRLQGNQLSFFDDPILSNQNATIPSLNGNQSLGTRGNLDLSRLATLDNNGYTPTRGIPSLNQRSGRSGDYRGGPINRGGYDGYVR